MSTEREPHSEQKELIRKCINSSWRIPQDEREALAALDSLFEQLEKLEAENLRLAGEMPVLPQPIYDPSERERAERLQEQHQATLDLLADVVRIAETSDDDMPVEHRAHAYEVLQRARQLSNPASEPEGT